MTLGTMLPYILSGLSTKLSSRNSCPASYLPCHPSSILQYARQKWTSHSASHIIGDTGNTSSSISYHPTTTIPPPDKHHHSLPPSFSCPSIPNLPNGRTTPTARTLTGTCYVIHFPHCTLMMMMMMLRIALKNEEEEKSRICNAEGKKEFI